MIEIPEKITPPLSGSTAESINSRVRGALSNQNLQDLNGATNYRTRSSGYKTNYRSGDASGVRIPPKGPYDTCPQTPRRNSQPYRTAVPQMSANGHSQIPPNTYSHPQAAVSRTSAASQSTQPAVSSGGALSDLVLPNFTRPLQKGQKSPIDPMGGVLHKIRASFGWNLKGVDCDIDASAFLLDMSGKVPDDSWFVFYGQPESPDGSVSFAKDSRDGGRESIPIDLDRLSGNICRIVFVLTIHEAFARKQNFSMVKDAYIRLLNADTGKELLSFCMDQYYENVTSMTIGEIYLHNGQWKFNPVGNGVNKDLAGQCAIYGVEIEG